AGVGLAGGLLFGGGEAGADAAGIGLGVGPERGGGEVIPCSARGGGDDGAPLSPTGVSPGSGVLVVPGAAGRRGGRSRSGGGAIGSRVNGSSASAKSSGVW